MPCEVRGRVGLAETHVYCSLSPSRTRTQLRVQELEMENTALKEKLKSLEYMELDFEMRLANIR